MPKLRPQDSVSDRCGGRFRRHLVRFEGVYGLPSCPGIEVCDGYGFHRADHVGMSFATELGADDEGFHGFHGCEPHRDLLAWDRILLNTHWNDHVIVDHILRSDVEHGGAKDGEFQGGNGEIVVGVRIGVVDTEVVRAGNE